MHVFFYKVIFALDVYVILYGFFRNETLKNVLTGEYDIREMLEK